jgi:clan AA aspartic protease
MITGQVSAHREAVVKLEVHGPGGIKIEVWFVLDSGFSEYLTLPPSLIASLGLLRRSATPMYLADGSRIAVDIYEGTVVWAGQPRMIGIHSVDGDALLGMALLYGSRLTVDVIDGGPVTISPLP